MNKSNRTVKAKDAKKAIAFRINNDVTAEFKAVCKANGIKQSSVIEKAMLIAIEQIKEMARLEEELSEKYAEASANLSSRLSDSVARVSFLAKEKFNGKK